MLSPAEEAAGVAWVGCGKAGVVSVFLGGIGIIAKSLDVEAGCKRGTMRCADSEDDTDRHQEGQAACESRKKPGDRCPPK